MLTEGTMSKKKLLYHLMMNFRLVEYISFKFKFDTISKNGEQKSI